MSHDDTCPGCGQDHADLPPFKDCGHPVDGQGECHTSTLMHCPHHFAVLLADAMGSSLPGAQPGKFRTVLLHLNNDAMAVNAWLVWMAMLNRYAVPPGADRLKAIAAAAPPPLPDAPRYYAEALPLITHAYSSAVLGDFSAVQQVMHTANHMLDENGQLCFLKSCAASTAVAAETGGCTPESVAVWGLLGSQVGTAAAAEVLPLLVDMVMAQARVDTAATLPLVKSLLALPGAKPLMVAVDIVARAMAQTVSTDATVLFGSGMPGDANAYDGMVDVERAEPEHTDRAVMAGVWAVRAQRAYSGATSAADATARLRAVARSHGDSLRFALDVIVAGTQMLGYGHALDMAEADGSTPA